MKKITINVFAFILAFCMISGVSFAIWVGDEKNTKLSGPHWQFNIIGHPKNFDVLGNDHGNGRAIMVPLKNVRDKILPA